MRGGNSRCFGAVVLDASDPFSTETIRGLEDACARADVRRRCLLHRRLPRARGTLSPAARGTTRAGHRDHSRHAQPAQSRDAARPRHLRRAPGQEKQRRRVLLGLGRPHARRRAGRRPSVRSGAPPDRVHQRASAPVAVRGAAPRHASRGSEGWSRRQREHHRMHDRSDHRGRARRAGGRQLPEASRAAHRGRLRQRPHRLRCAADPGRARGSGASRHERGRVRRRRFRSHVVARADVDSPAQVRARPRGRPASDRGDSRPFTSPRRHPLRAGARSSVNRRRRAPG